VNAALRYRRGWTALGMAMIAFVVVASLVNVPQPVPVRGVDKLHHLVAYGAMMFWWGMLQPRRRWAWAAGVIALGAALEFTQSLTPYRHMDWRDLAFNVGGVALASVLLRTPAAGLLAWIDGQLRDRLDPGAP